MNRYITIILLLSLCTSCYTTEGLQSHISSNAMVLHNEVLTGLYENKIPNDDVNTLWNDLCLHFPKKRQNIAKGNQVYISYNGTDELTVELFEYDDLIDTMVLKGKAKDKFFRVRKGSHFFTLVLITSIQSKKTIIGNDANGDLLIAQGSSHKIMFLEDDEEDSGAEVINGVYVRIGDDRPKSNSLLPAQN